MSTVIHCPECGGVVGAKQTTEHGPPCTCFPDAPHTPSPDDTDINDSPQQPTKLCVKCGKDLTGKKRLKDSHGYWCPDCHRADKAEKAPKGIPCPQCKRIVPPDSLISVDGANMCSRCVRNMRELKKAGSKKFREVDSTHFEKQNKKTLLIMLGVVIVLLLFVLYGRFFGQS